MGSPLSAVMACLFMEILEKDYFLKIMEETRSTWLCYVDDIIFISTRESEPG